MRLDFEFMVISVPKFVEAIIVTLELSVLSIIF